MVEFVSWCPYFELEHILFLHKDCEREMNKKSVALEFKYTAHRPPKTP